MLSELFGDREVRDWVRELQPGDKIAVYQNCTWTVGYFDSIDKGSIYLQTGDGKRRHAGRLKRARILKHKEIPVSHFPASVCNYVRVNGDEHTICHADAKWIETRLVNYGMLKLARTYYRWCDSHRQETPSTLSLELLTKENS